VPPDAEAAAVAFGPLEGRVVGSDGRYEAAVSVPRAERGAVELEVQLAPAAEPDGSPSVEGRLTARLDELDFVSQLSSQIEGVGGAVRGDLALSGTMAAPALTGEVVLEDGRATVPAANVTLEDVGVRLEGGAAGELGFSASMRSGDGTFEAGGRLELVGGGAYGEIEISGTDFQALNTPDARIVISPELALTLDAEQILLTGTVQVPSARIAPRSTRGEAVAASRDEVVLVEGQSESAAAGASRPLRAEVTVALGEDVTIDAFGLAGELAGSIDITETPGEPTTASGEFRVVDGSYEAYGQELEIRTGRVLFAGGALTRPGLDIEAVRRPTEDILVGARVRGTLEQPELELFSEPGMPQQEQLSYLVLGRPLQGASSSEESALSRAALALGLRGGNFVSERINESLGLDEFGIQTAPGEDASSAAFVIGKYLSPKLYVSYGVGLFEPVTTLNLRYTITDRWRLMTESSSEGSGGDVVYSIERSSD
jgi:translocation and assembly module TamB